MFKVDYSLKPFNTFGIEVKAQKFARFSSVEELNNLFQEIKAQSWPFLILGGGSNVLFRDDFKGVVLRNEMKGISYSNLNENEVVATCGAGEVWHEFVLNTISEGLYGIENLSLIPGSVGASPMQNIGAYGVEIKDVFHELKAYHIATGEIHTFNKEACAFGYRESVFKRTLKNQYVIVEVSFILKKKAELNTSYGAINDELKQAGIDSPTLKDVSDAVIRIRQSKLPNPAEIGNAGSFFKNPVVSNSLAEKIIRAYPEAPVYPVKGDENHKKLAAGWLIEQCGLKGLTLENHGVHKKQALVLVNYGSATGNEIFELSSRVIGEVKEKFGVELEREVNII